MSIIGKKVGVVDATPKLIVNEEPAKKVDESSVVEIAKDVYGQFTATWQKYGRAIKVKSTTDVGAIEELVKEINRIVDQENAAVMADFTKDAKMQEFAIEQATRILDIMQGKWFRLDELQKKVSKITLEQLGQSINTLRAFNLVVAKTGPTGTKYKITFTNEQRIEIIREQQEVHQKEIDKLAKDIQDLEQVVVNDSPAE